MSATDQIAGSSTDTFTAIFNAASIEYQTVTGRRLDVHPLAAQLDTCHTPDAISHVFRTQVRAFRKFRKGDEKLMAWLDPIVHILFTFSATLGEGIGLVSTPFIPYGYCDTSIFQPFSPAKTIFSGVGVLLCVSLSFMFLLGYRRTIELSGCEGCRGKPQQDFAHF
jgi:hypothetical protein